MLTLLLQAPLTAEIVNDPAVQQGASIFSDPAVLLAAVIVGAVSFFLVVLLIIRGLARKGKSIPDQYRKHILRVLVPKESLQQKGETKTQDSQQSIRESIGVAETFFSAIGGLKPQKGIAAWFLGREDTISLEIVAEDEEISFYLGVPQYLLRFIEQQVQAQYPHAQIEEVEDYNIFHPQGYVSAAGVKFAREWYFPVKTYQESETDPLNALTQPLSQIAKEDGAVIQFVVRSAPSSWHEWGRKIASEMRQGKSYKQANKEVKGGIAKFFGDIFSSAKKPGQELSKPIYQLSPLEEEMIKRLETKSSKAGVEANIRVITSSKLQANAKLYLDSIVGAFAQFNIYEYGNSFKPVYSKQERIIEDYIFRRYTPKQKIILNTEELASLYHFPLPQTETSNIKWLTAKRAPAPLATPQSGQIQLGYNEYRGKKTPVWMLREDRRRHMYIIGKSGSGKSYHLTSMARQDIANGEGVCVIDPHGDLVDDVLAGIPKERVEDVVIFDPSDIEYPLGMNLLDYDPNYPEQKTFVINEMLKIFDKLYDLKSTGGPMFEQYMRNAMLLIMDDPESGSTLMEISKVLADEDFRSYKLSKCKNQVVVDFWRNEAEKAGGEAALANMVPYITSKLNQFTANDVMRPIIGQQKSAFNFRDLMDNKKILLVKLSKGKIGELNAHLLGMVIVGKILMAALSRTDQPKDQRKDFYLYIDEFQNFTTDSIAIILSEARKYLLDLIIAHQYVGQLVEGGNTEIKDAVFGNVGTILAYKIGVEDAEIFAKEFAPVFNEYDVLNIEQYTSYIKLLVHNQTLRPFNLRALPWEGGHSPEVVNAIYELSRAKYGVPRIQVEQDILQRGRKANDSPANLPRKRSPFDDL